MTGVGFYLKAGALCAIPLIGQFQIGTGLHLGMGRFEGGKLLIPRNLRVVPRISQVSENGILSAYVSRLGSSK